MTTFATRFETALRAKGLSRRELARLSGIHPNTLNNWASGKSKNPQPDQLRAVMPHLGVTYEYLRTGEGSMYPSPLESYARSVPGDNRDSMVCEPADASYAPKPPDPLDAALLQRAIQEALAFAPSELPERLAQAITDAYHTALRTRRLDKVGELVRTFLS